MDNIYFKKVIARGIGKRESIVDFTNGLNIICGLSNTGKTLIFKVMKQVFGSDNRRNESNDDEAFTIENDTGYTDFSLVISKNEKDITLTRHIDSDFINIESNHPDIASGKYEYTAKFLNESINYVLLKIFGVEPFRLPNKQDGTSTNFSIKFLDYLFLADEERIDKGSQILIFNSKKYQSITQSKANLLYLLYDMDFSHFLKPSDKNQAKARKGVLKDYINRKLEENEKEIRYLKEQLTGIESNEDNSSEIQHRLDEVRNCLAIKYNESTKVNSEIQYLTEKMESDTILIGRLENLSRQYKSDFDRAEFIASGKDVMDEDRKIHHCPYCHSLIKEQEPEIDEHKIKSVISDAVQNFNDTCRILSRVEKEHSANESKVRDLKKRFDQLQQEINELSKERIHLENSLRHFSEFINCRNRIAYLQKNNELFENDLTEISESKATDKVEFIPDKHFKPSFFSSMTSNIREIMQYCGDPRFISADFDKNTFDISIRGQMKSSNNGKGYRSFANSVTLIAFRKLLENEGKNILPVYVIDSPFKNLDTGETDENGIKGCFLRYLLEASKTGQIIIIENTNNFILPDDLKNKANIIEFTHGTKEGRYGFLLDYKD